jgi:ATP-dependent phosphoenolpyruvate carboxykinase
MDPATDTVIRSELARLGLCWVDRISWNAPAPVLYQEAVTRGEGIVAEGGALVVTTGQHTGRSPNDKFVVRDETTENTIWWDNNKAMSRGAFETLKKDFMAHARLKRPLCAGFGRRRRSRIPAPHPRHHRIRLACAVHPASSHRTERSQQASRRS